MKGPVSRADGQGAGTGRCHGEGCLSRSVHKAPFKINTGGAKPFVVQPHESKRFRCLRASFQRLFKAAGIDSSGNAGGQKHVCQSHSLKQRICAKKRDNGRRLSTGTPSCLFPPCFLLCQQLTCISLNWTERTRLLMLPPSLHSLFYQ